MSNCQWEFLYILFTIESDFEKLKFIVFFKQINATKGEKGGRKLESQNLESFVCKFI